MNPNSMPKPNALPIGAPTSNNGESDFTSLDNLPWTGITVLFAVVGLLFFMAVPMRKSTAREQILAYRARAAVVATGDLRSAIEEYHADHSEWPGQPPSMANSLGPVTFEELSLRRQLEMNSNSGGSTIPTASTEYHFGPYLPNGIPLNPRNNLASIRVLQEGETFRGIVDGIYGWVYDPRTGEIQPHELPFQNLPKSKKTIRRAGSITHN
ncbi:MAG: hypothetical protein ACI8X5_001689 [Planctomycetota bacterium]|jgi:hypothetical protein